MHPIQKAHNKTSGCIHVKQKIVPQPGLSFSVFYRALTGLLLHV